MVMFLILMMMMMITLFHIRLNDFLLVYDFILQRYMLLQLTILNLSEEYIVLLTKSFRTVYSTTTTTIVVVVVVVVVR